MIRRVVGGLIGLLLTGCSVVGPTQVVVSAAASLTEVLAELEATYEADNRDTNIVLNLAGSQTLAGQIISGSPADVFASANPQSVRAVQQAGLGLGDPIGLATNQLVLVVPAGNPHEVQGFDDIIDLAVVLGAPEVPVGAYARQALAAAGITIQPVSEEPDTRAVVARIAAGDADVGIAYSTDVRALAGVEAVDIPAAFQPEIRYEVMLLTTRGEGFLEFLAGPDAQQVFRDAGFDAP